MHDTLLTLKMKLLRKIKICIKKVLIQCLVWWLRLDHICMSCTSFSLQALVPCILKVDYLSIFFFLNEFGKIRLA